MLFTDPVELFGLRSDLCYIGSSHLDSTKKDISLFLPWRNIWCTVTFLFWFNFRLFPHLSEVDVISERDITKRVSWLWLDVLIIFYTIQITRYLFCSFPITLFTQPLDCYCLCKIFLFQNHYTVCSCLKTQTGEASQITQSHTKNVLAVPVSFTLVFYLVFTF